MRIEMWPVDRIQPDPNHPHISDGTIEQVAQSILENGFPQPMVVDEDDIIILGHIRWSAAKKLGLADVPVHVACGLSPEQANDYRLADQKLGELAKWDRDMRMIELADLQDLEFDLSSLGFVPQK